MTRSLPQRTGMVAAVLLIGLSSAARAAQSASDAHTVASAPASTQATPTGDQYRRIFVPADRVDEVLQGQQRFLPIPRAEFERLAELGSQSNRPPGARITRASVHAQLEGNRLIQGSARLEVQHTGEEPAWLPLETAGFAVANMRWTDDRLATGGSYYRHDATESEYGVVVDTPGTVQFDWTANGRPFADGVRFELTLPEAVSTELIVVASTPVRLSAEGASILSRSADDTGAVEYRLAVRGGEPFSLQTAPLALGESQHNLAVRHVTSYNITPSATQIASQVRLLPLSQPVREIVLVVPSSLQILDLSLGGQPLEFRKRPVAGGKDETLVDVELGQPLPAGETELRIRGLAATELDLPLDLPSIRLERSIWLGGTVQMGLDDALQLQDLVHEGFRPTTPPAREDDRGFRWSFEQVLPRAALQVMIGRSPKQLAADTFTSVEMGREELTAEATVELTSLHGAESILRGSITADWEITSVESQPSGLVRSWSTDGENGRGLTVVLNQPVAPRQPARIRLKARRQRPPDESSVSASRLAFVRLAHLQSDRQWMEVLPHSTFDVYPDGTGTLQTVGLAELPASFRSLTSRRTSSYLLAVPEDPEEVVFRTRSRSAELSADLGIDAQVTGSSLRYDYRFRIEPRSGFVTRLGVVFSEPLDAPPRWRFLVPSGQEELAAERLAEADRDMGPGGQTPSRAIRWRLAQPQTEPFNLLLSFEKPWDGNSALVLAAVDAPGSQSGTVSLSANRAISLALENRELEPIAPQPNPTSSETFRAAYRFQPEQTLLSDGGSPLMIRRVEAEEMAPPAWIRTARLDSIYLPNGHLTNRLSMSIENHGRQHLDIHLPPAASILYRHGGTAWRELAADGGIHPIAIPLPSDLGTVPVEVRFSSRQQPLGSFASVHSPPLRLSVPVGQFDRHVWIPGSFRAVTPASPADRLLSGFAVLGDWLSATTSTNAPPDELAAEQARLREVSVAPGDEPQVVIVHLTTLRFWCVACLCLGALFGGYLSRERQRWTAIAAAGAFAAALVLPAALAPLASSLAWGCLAAILFHAALAPATFLVRQLPRAGARPREAAATTVLLLVGISLAPHPSLAAETEEEASIPVYQVIDPIDGDRQSTGEHVFVPESLYSSLLRRERERREPLGRWLITRCRVRGALGGNTATAPQPFQVLIELETFQSHTEIRLPMPRDLVASELSSLQVDGATPASWWSEGGRSLHVRIPQAGPHHLELTVTPREIREAGVRELAVPLIGAEETYVELSVPEEMPELTFPGVRGEVKYVPASSTYRGHVGPIRQLVVNWPAAGTSSAAAVPLDVLTWMYVQQTATLIEQRLLIDAEEDESLYVDVLLPAGVRFIPSARELPYARISVTANGSERVSLAIEPRQTGRVVMPLQFLQEYPAGTTSIPVPRWIMEGNVDLRERWLAIQAAPDVWLDPQPGTTVEPVKPDEFLRRWGPAEIPPTLVYREGPPGSSWRLEFQPQLPRVEAAESMTILARPSGVEVHYRADCRVTEGAILVQQIDNTGDLRISSVRVEQATGSRPARWSKGGDGRMRVLLPEPTNGAFTLLMEGEIPADEEGGIAVPMLDLEAVPLEAPRLTAARTPGTVLELQRSDSLQPASNASLPAEWEDDWVLHGQYTWADSRGGRAVIRGKVAQSPTPHEVRMVTALAPDLRGWDVTVQATVRGSGLSLDRLVFIGPREWTEPFEVEPSSRWRVTVQEEAGHNRVILKPRVPVGDEVRVTLRSTLTQSRPDLVTVPAIRLAEPAAEDHFVALPQTTSGQSTVWETQHLVEIGNADDLLEPIGDATEWKLYRTSMEQATARVTVVEQSPSAPLISFAEMVVRLQRREPHFGEATFTLDPRGQRSCEIALPQGYRLLDAHVNGRRLSLYEAAPGRWQVQLESSHLPQLITVAWRGRAANAEGTLRLQAPTLLTEGTQIPVLQTAWNVVSDRPSDQFEPDEEAPPPVSRSMLAAVRIANLVESLDEIVPALVGSSPETWAPWLAYWRDRVAAAETRFARSAQIGPADPDAAQAVEAARQRLAGIEEELSPSSPATSDAGAEAIGSSFSAADSGAGKSLRLLGEGSIDAIRLRVLTDRPDHALDRVLGVVLLCAVAGGLVPFRRDTDGAEEQHGMAVLFAVLFAAALIALIAGSLAATVAVLGASATALGWKFLRARRISREAAEGP